MIRRISLMTGAVLVMAACGGSSDPAVAPAVSDSPPSNDASASPELPELSVDDLPLASLGAFAVDLHSARITPQILAGYGDPNVHQIAAEDANAGSPSATRQMRALPTSLGTGSMASKSGGSTTMADRSELRPIRSGEAPGSVTRSTRNFISTRHRPTRSRQRSRMSFHRSAPSC